MKPTLEEKLFDAIDDEQFNLIKPLLEQGVNPNVTVDGFTPLAEALAIFPIGEKLYSVTELLLEYGANPNQSSGEEQYFPIHNIMEYPAVDVMKLLLENRADPNISILMEGLPLFCAAARQVKKNMPRASGEEIDHTSIAMATLLLKHGAYCTINDFSASCGCLSLASAARDLNIPMLKLLLDYGADTTAVDEDGFTAIEALPEKTENISSIWNSVFELVKHKNLPYLKVKEDKYIIYEKKNDGTYLLADVGNNKGKKYLYHNSDIAIFLLWSAENELLIDNAQKTINLVRQGESKINDESLLSIMKNSIGNTLNSGLYLEKHQDFVVAYLTVTGWFYNLHSDLKKIYPEKKGFADLSQIDENHKELFALLDLRYKQYQTSEHYNANDGLEILT